MFAHLGETAHVVEVLVTEPDVGDIRPCGADVHECPADRLTAARCAGVDQHDAACIGDNETTDLKAHRIGAEHPGRHPYLGNNGFDRRTLHRPTIA